MNFFGTILLFMFYILVDTQAECINDKKSQPQWFMQFSVRGISSRDPTTSEGILIQKNDEQLPKITGITQSTQNAMSVVQRSMEVPLVLLGTQFYYFIDYFKTNYFTAFQFCRDHGMDLLSIETREENELILNYLKHNQTAVDHMWTSGTDLGKEGKFVWLSTGKKYGFTDWKTPQPDNAGNVEDCMEIWKLSDNNYVWNDIVCANEYYFMCEVTKKSCSREC